MMDLKSLHLNWLRSSALFSSSHQQLEDELKRMKERKVNQELIDRKDFQIEALVNFFNQTDELIQAYKLALSNARLENHFITELLMKKIKLADLMAYKPSKAIQIISIESGNTHTLSELDGQDRTT